MEKNGGIFFILLLFGKYDLAQLLVKFEMFRATLNF